jgi:Flp pilus assembly protein TadD
MISYLLRRLRGQKATDAPCSEEEMENELDTHLGSAAAYQAVGRGGQALTACNQALTLDPTNAQAYHLRALAKYNLGDRAGARKDWAKSTHLRTGSGRSVLMNETSSRSCSKNKG